MYYSFTHVAVLADDYYVWSSKPLWCRTLKGSLQLNIKTLTLKNCFNSLTIVSGVTYQN